MKRVLTSLGLALLATLAARAEVPVTRLFAHVPAEAALVVAVPNLDRLASSLAEFGRQIEVEKLAGLDSRGLLKQLELLEGTEGLDTAGPWVLALTPGCTSALVLCTARDPETWRQGATPEPGETGLYRVRLFGEETLAALESDVVMICDDVVTLRAALQGSNRFEERFGPRPAQWCATHQLVVGLHVPAWAPLLVPALNAAQSAVGMAMAVGKPQPDISIQSVVWLFDMAREVLGQLEQYSLGVRIDATGITWQDAAVCRADGSIADYLGKVRRTQNEPLRGLPNEDFLFVFASDWERPAGLPSLSTKLMDSLLRSDALKERVATEQFQRAYRAALEVQEHIRGFNLAMVTSPPPEQFLAFSSIQFTSEPQRVLENMRCAYELDPALLGAFGLGDNIAVRCGAERIGPTEAYTFEMSFGHADPDSRRLFEAMYGPAMLTCTAMHPLGVVTTAGSGNVARTRLVHLVKGDAAPLAGNLRVIAARSAIAPHPQVLILVDVPRFFNFAVRMGHASGAPMPPVRCDAPGTALVSYGGYFEERTLRSEIFIPAEPVRELVKTVRALECEDTPPAPTPPR